MRRRLAQVRKSSPRLSAAETDRLFHALGDATRRALLDRLSAAPQSVTKLAAPLGVSVTAVMQHVTILERARLVHSEKLGRVRTCRIEPSGFNTLDEWVRMHRTMWEKRLDRLGEVLEEE